MTADTDVWVMSFRRSDRGLRAGFSVVAGDGERQRRRVDVRGGVGRSDAAKVAVTFQVTSAAGPVIW